MNFQDLRRLTDSFMQVRTLQVATELKLFDVLASEARTAVGVAEALHLEPRATELFCNALTGMGLLEKRDKTFINSGLAERYLVTSAPQYYGWIIRHNTNLWENWGRLSESLKNGKPITDRKTARRDDVEWEDFIMGMHSIIVARGDAKLLAEKVDASECQKMLDLGGGPGTFAITFCETYPNLSANLFDLPEALKVARKNVDRYSEVRDRMNLVEGNFITDQLPGGNDLILASNIIHMYNEADNAALMKKAVDTLNPGGRILVKDHILNDDLTLPMNGSVFSLHMLLHTEGRDYGYHEIKKWLEDAGCSDVSLLDIPDETPYGVVVGVK